MTDTDALPVDGCSCPACRRKRAEGDTCRECGCDLGAGYLCDDCDTVEGWPDDR